MTRKLMTVVTLVVAVMAIAPLAHAIPIVNGSFEDDVWATERFDLETAGLTGWVVNDPGNNSPLYPWGIHEGLYGPTPYGSQFVVIGGFGADLGTSIQQTVGGLTVGETYALSFALATEGYSTGGFTGNSNVLVNMLAGSATASAIYSPVISVNNYWDTWAMYSYNFVANANSATFAFEDLAMTGQGYDIGIDNVSLAATTAVPEPGTIALLGMGLAGAGLRLRRRKS